MPLKSQDTPEMRDEFVAAYVENKCQFNKTCLQLGHDRGKVLEWRKIYPEFQKNLALAEDLLNERVEESLIDVALDPKGNIVAKIFHLKNNWKEKYGDKMVHEVEPSQLWFEKKEPKVIEAFDKPQIEEQNPKHP